jgi:hypothetical protein
VSKENPHAPSVDPVAADVQLVRAARAKLIEETGYRSLTYSLSLLGKSRFSVTNCPASIGKSWQPSVWPP